MAYLPIEGYGVIGNLHTAAITPLTVLIAFHLLTAWV